MKSKRESRAGFTIIEVILFLALSSGMIIVAMLSIRGRTDAVQFTDAVQSTDAFFERRQDQILRGVITGETEQCRWTGAGYSAAASDGTCVFLGYMYFLDPARPSEIDVMQMYGARLPSNDPCFAANPDYPLPCVSPTATPVGGAPSAVETYQIPWGVEVFRTWSGTGNSRFFGFLRNPIGQNIIPVSFDSSLNAGNLDDAALYGDVGNTQVGDEFSGVICLESPSGKRASITHGGHEDQFAIVADFDQGNTPVFCS